MKEHSGRILHFAEENRPVAGCTVSKQIYHENGTGIPVFFLAAHTSISPE